MNSGLSIPFPGGSFFSVEKAVTGPVWAADGRSANVQMDYAGQQVWETYLRPETGTELIRATADVGSLKTLVAGLGSEGDHGYSLAKTFPVPVLASQPMQPGPAVAMWRKLQKADPGLSIGAVLIPARTWEHQIAQDPAELRKHVVLQLGIARTQPAAVHFARRQREQAAFWRKIMNEERDFKPPDGDPYQGLLGERKRLQAADAWTVDPDEGFPTFQFQTQKRDMSAFVQDMKKRYPDGGSGLDHLLDEQVRLVVMAVDPAELTAYLGFGCFNECPCAYAQVPILRRWRQDHGARLIFIGRDLLEFWVERPPTDSQVLIDLAWQHHLFCSDVISQGAGSLEALVEGISGSNKWFFWWD